jgi:hypothetical protein
VVALAPPRHVQSRGRYGGIGVAEEPATATATATATSTGADDTEGPTATAADRATATTDGPEFGAAVALLALALLGTGLAPRD